MSPTTVLSSTYHSRLARYLVRARTTMLTKSVSSFARLLATSNQPTWLMPCSRQFAICSPKARAIVLGSAAPAVRDWIKLSIFHGGITSSGARYRVFARGSIGNRISHASTMRRKPPGSAGLQTVPCSCGHLWKGDNTRCRSLKVRAVEQRTAVLTANIRRLRWSPLYRK